MLIGLVAVRLLSCMLFFSVYLSDLKELYLGASCVIPYVWYSAIQRFSMSFVI